MKEVTELSTKLVVEFLDRSSYVHFGTSRVHYSARPSELNVFRGPMMKKLCLLVASLFVILMLSCMPAFADASPNGCKNSDGKASGCSDPTTAPEPGSLGLLAAGILVVGVGAAIVRRRRLLHN